jgi:hypothetical protein
MVFIKIEIPYAPLSMNILDIYLFFQTQTGNQVSSVREYMHQDRNGKFKSFIIYANARVWSSIFIEMNYNQRIVRYIQYRNKYAKIRAWIYEA